MYRRDTIAAVATPPGMGGVAIVRVSGPDAAAVAASVFHGFPEGGPEPRRLYAGAIMASAGDVLDRGLAVLMPGPASYTGEDVLELHCHGGMLLVREVLAAVLAAGARGAERGEFTLRAFLNGKLDLAQAESIADLVSARSSGGMRAAVRQLEGELSRALEAIRERVVDIAARLELAIDFTDEDVERFDAEPLAAKAADLTAELRTMAATYRHGRVLREGIRVAIVGKPNVGKSSLLNRLLGTDRSIVTAVPGTTRDVIEESVDVGGVALVLADTAGIRHARDEVEAIGIERTRAEIAAADLTIVVLDVSRSIDADDQAVLDAARQKPRVLVANKIDLERAVRGTELASLAGAESVVETSMRTGHGIDHLKQRALEAIGLTEFDEGSLVVTRERHRAALEAAAVSLDLVEKSLREGRPADLVAVDVMRCLDHIGEIVGTTSPEAILDRIFSEFCIGK